MAGPPHRTCVQDLGDGLRALDVQRHVVQPAVFHEEQEDIEAVLQGAVGLPGQPLHLVRVVLGPEPVVGGGEGVGGRINKNKNGEKRGVVGREWRRMGVGWSGMDGKYMNVKRLHVASMLPKLSIGKNRTIIYLFSYYNHSIKTVL